MAYKAGICSVDGCGPTNRMHKGFCHGHYSRFMRYGDPIGPMSALIVSPRRVRKLEIVGDVAHVPLSQGKIAIIDAADADIVGQYNWSALEDNRTFYARTKINGKGALLHNLLCAPGPGFIADHADGNGLNNLRSNLRPATLSQNQANKSMAYSNKSGFKGVSRASGVTGPKHWRAAITKERKYKSLGYFYTPVEAAQAYDAAAFEAWGEYAKLNFGRV